MKKKMLLDTALKIKDSVEKSIVACYDDIVKYNLTDVKAGSLLERAEKLEQQLIHLKEVIQEANKGKHKDGKTNNYYIYYLSNVVLKNKFYESLEKGLNRAPAKAKTAHIKRDEVASKKRTIGEEINNLRNKLSLFNTKKKVTIYLDESLDLWKDE